MEPRWERRSRSYTGPISDGRQVLSNQGSSGLQAQHREPALAGDGLGPVVLVPGRWLGPEPNGVRAVVGGDLFHDPTILERRPSSATSTMYLAATSGS